MKLTMITLFIVWSNGYYEYDSRHDNLKECERMKDYRIEQPDMKQPKKYLCVEMSGSIGE